MSRPLFLGALTVAACAAVVGWRTFERLSPDTFTENKVAPPEAAPVCPWREPESDLKAFFPEATGYHAETRILSGVRSELGERLGRFPTGDENILRVYRAYQNERVVGSILTRRVKGEFGGIELVLATDTNRNVRGVRLQRLREPERIANALQDGKWLSAFAGKGSEGPWSIGKDIPDVPAEARGSADAVVEGVRSLLISLTVAELPHARDVAETHRH